MNLKLKLNLLEKLKKERDTKEQKLRFGVKPRWKGNPLTYFGYLQETLITKRKGRLT